ncbi:hypothetical protein FKP32DRAFT_951760 [Trametes sanguinea]|nr:hypothetical protein FKP32DRAFT_951760 [Trametes sanguinea]
MHPIERVGLPSRTARSPEDAANVKLASRLRTIGPRPPSLLGVPVWRAATRTVASRASLLLVRPSVTANGGSPERCVYVLRTGGPVTVSQLARRDFHIRGRHPVLVQSHAGLVPRAVTQLRVRTPLARPLPSGISQRLNIVARPTGFPDIWTLPNPRPIVRRLCAPNRART